jgi:sterol desaturase/sphingolipid hydroxylase (fatty acid hydroxylase superfamily)
MIGIPLGLAVFTVGEWAAHKYLLHELGRDKASRFSFHFHGHHQSVRRHGFYDPDYAGPVWSTPTQAREAIGLAAVGLAHAPLLPVAPFYTATIWWCLARYRRLHRRAHLDPEWGRTHLPWHYDHHMGPNQDRNWGVTTDWFDKLVGTKRPFAGSAKDAVGRLRGLRRVTEARLADRPKRSVTLATLFGGARG